MRRDGESLDAYAKRLQARINEKLSLYGTGGDTTQDYARQVIGDLLPAGWDYVDATRVGGPASIVITSYGG